MALVVQEAFGGSKKTSKSTPANTKVVSSVDEMQAAFKGIFGGG